MQEWLGEFDIWVLGLEGMRRVVWYLESLIVECLALRSEECGYDAGTIRRRRRRWPQQQEVLAWTALQQCRYESGESERERWCEGGVS